MKRALTIAGSDSGAGAGIQADLKTFASCGVYGTSVITAITAQNTLGVTGVLEVPLEMIAAQLDAVLSDIGADAAKTGMLSSAPIIELVSTKLREWNVDRLVVDPVMVAKGGDRLLREDAVATLKKRLLPLAFVLTPNLPEAEALVGHRVRTREQMEEAARALATLGARHIVIKGGHTEGPPVDLLFDGNGFTEYPGERINSTNTHGTGCTFAAAIAAQIARGLGAAEAVGEAKRYTAEAIRQAPGIGRGHGPLNHFPRRTGATTQPVKRTRKECMVVDYDAEATRSLTHIAEHKPLIHQITNLVVTNDSANLTLGFGALPVMAYAPEEVAEMAALSQALVLNIGTLSAGEIEAMLIAGRAAAGNGVPIVLDPVGAGATRFRTESALRLLSELPVTVLRGNRGEIGALVGSGQVRGVEATGTEDPRAVAAAAAERFGLVTAVTGPVDVIVAGERALDIANGHPLLGRITGSGCMATAAIGIFLTAGDDPLVQAGLALAAYGLAAERAAIGDPGPGTFRSRLLDEVAALGTGPITGLKVSGGTVAHT